MHVRSTTPIPILLLALAAPAAAQTYFPPPVTPPGNPTTPQKALLGKVLFWDEQLSASRTVACGTCHIFGSGGTDPRSLAATNPGPDGVFGTADDIHGSPGVILQDGAGNHQASARFGIRPQATGRKAPSPINAVYDVELFWDGRASDAFVDPVTGAVVLPAFAALESQAAGPPVSDVEMSHMGRSWTDIANDLAALVPLALADNIPANMQAFITGKDYAQLFQQVFGSPGVTPQRIIFAIAAYERTLIADQSPYDHYVAGTGTLTAQEIAGLNAFSGMCMICHLDVFADSHLIGPGLNSYFKLGVRPDREDVGRYAVTSNPADMGLFRTTQLRNVALRAPYMHTGGLATLGDVIDFYNQGGGPEPGVDPQVTSLAGLISPQERADMIAFLQTLTDPRVQNQLPPFDRPRLWSESPRVPQVYGLGTAGAGGFVPAMIEVSPPYVGNAKFAIGLDRVPPATMWFLLLDLLGSATPTPLLGQNYYLTSSAVVHSSGITQVGSGGPGAGYASLLLPVPPAQLLAGLPVHGQWMVLDPAGPFGVTSSDAFSMRVF
jgi:cytochrome c peroxidase